MISRAWLFRWLPVVGYLGLITYLSSQTGSGLLISARALLRI